MHCPLCIDEVLDTRFRSGVEIDVCPRCRGVWLDRNELDTLAGPLVNVPPPPGVSDAGYGALGFVEDEEAHRRQPRDDDHDDDDDDDDHDDDDDDDDDDGRDRRRSGKRRRMRIRKLGSWLADVVEEVFD